MWLHNISDSVIWFSYMAIPALLIYFVRRRRDVPFHWMFLMFGAFIVWCGLTHLMGLVMFYYPMYRLSGLVKLITATVSLATVFALVPITPRALSLPGLANLTRDLKDEIEQRTRVQEAQRQQTKDLARINEELQRFSSCVVGRETRMIELKQEVNELASRLGESRRYRIKCETDDSQR